MFVKRSVSYDDSNMEIPSSFNLEFRNGNVTPTIWSNYNTDLSNNNYKKEALTPSITMLIIFIIPTILILFCLCVGYFCRKWAREGETLSRFVSRTDEMDAVVTTSAPLTPPPAYPDDKPPTYDEALQKEITANINNDQIAPMGQSRQSLCY